MPKDSIDLVAAFGLTLGAVFGMAGTFMTQPPLQALSWAIDGAGLVMAGALLALKCARLGRDIVAGGFLVFAIAEAVMMSGLAAGPVGSVPAFAAGTALWSTALLLVSIPRYFAAWVRLPGIAAAILFAIVSARIHQGEQLLPTSTPLPYFAYPILVATFVGWIWELLRGKGGNRSA